VFSERHDGAIETMNIDGRVDGRIHSDAANLANVRKRQDVGNRLGVVPDFA
jgi:hypothetical protein